MHNKNRPTPKFIVMDKLEPSLHYFLQTILFNLEICHNVEDMEVSHQNLLIFAHEFK